MELRRLLEGNNFFRIPMKRISSNHYLIKAKIHNKIADLIVDTGASTTCVNIHDAAYFDIAYIENMVKAAGAGGGELDTMISYKNELEIEGWKDNAVGLVLFDLTHLNIVLNNAGEDSIHGILGSDFLKKHRAVIDYGRNCLYLKNKIKPQ